MHLVDEARLRDVLRRAPHNPRVIVSGNAVAPAELIDVLDSVYDEMRLWSINIAIRPPMRDGITHESPFIGPGLRRAPVEYRPSRLSLVPQMVRTTTPPDVVAVMVSEPVDGKVSLGLDCTTLPTAIEEVKARGGILVGQVNRHVPYTYGDTEVHVELFDALWSADREFPTPRPPVTEGPAYEEAARIGALVAERVPDGATLQLGVGEVPDAIMPHLTSRRGLHVWTELAGDWVLTLDRAGALAAGDVFTSSIVIGSPELYEWLHLNERFRMRSCEVTNSTAHIAAQPSMTSLNTALQIDLFAQANASRVGKRILTGFGGQTDFIVGAMHAPGGQAIMALRSIHPKRGTSTIVGQLDDPTTSFQQTCVITENGVADVFGCTEREQAANLIEHAAHPSVRDDLWESARELGLA